MASLGKGEDDVGSKRIRDTEDGFIMCKGGEGERVEIEDVVATENEKKNINNNNNNKKEEKRNTIVATTKATTTTEETTPPKDPAEALANLFHECLQNLSYLSAVVKMSREQR